MSASPMTPSERAADWLAKLPPHAQPAPIIPALCQRFALTEAEARLVVMRLTLAHGRAA